MREKEPVTSVIFVRHGKTDFPMDRIYCDDQEDPVLNSEGLTQAQAAAKWLGLQTINAIYTSPSSRTRMTAEAISKATKVPINEMEGLRERRFGLWDGLYFDQIAQSFPEEYLAWRKDAVHYTPAGGETIVRLKERVIATVHGIINNHKGKVVVIVSHVGPIRVCLTEAMNIPLEDYRQIRIDYGALTQIDYGSKQNNLIFSNISMAFFAWNFGN